MIWNHECIRWRGWWEMSEVELEVEVGKWPVIAKALTEVLRADLIHPDDELWCRSFPAVASSILFHHLQHSTTIRINNDINITTPLCIHTPILAFTLSYTHKSQLCLLSRTRLRPKSARLIRRYVATRKTPLASQKCPCPRPPQAPRILYLARTIANHSSLPAFQVSCLGQPWEADISPESLRFPRPYRNLLLLHLLQPWWTIPHQLGWFPHSRILLFGGLVQLGQIRWYSVAHSMSQIRLFPNRWLIWTF